MASLDRGGIYIYICVGLTGLNLARLSKSRKVLTARAGCSSFGEKHGKVTGERP